MPKIIDRYQVSLKALIENEHGEVLVLNALSDGTFAGYYDLPGGRIDTDEFAVPLLDILRREIREEVGDIDIELSEAPVAVGKHLLSAESEQRQGEPLRILYLLFRARYVGGAITISDEHSGFRWLNFDKHQLSDIFKSGLLDAVVMYTKSRQGSV
jgi:8-oxo-dGTP pyrophosphatase MutT (NUDIX family)